MPPKPTTAERLARYVLRGPAFVRRAAASSARGRDEAWMLRQSRTVRDGYVREVLDRGGSPKLAEIWMLRQPDEVRESYIREVLEPALGDEASR